MVCGAYFLLFVCELGSAGYGREYELHFCCNDQVLFVVCLRQQKLFGSQNYEMDFLFGIDYI